MDPSLTIVLPAYNAQDVLETCLRKLLSACSSSCRLQSVIIANNGSTDRTLDVALDLRVRRGTVQVLSLPLKGRGRALKAAWNSSQADILAYMDVDLSSDLNAFPELIEPLATGECDLATGSRLLQPSLTHRSLRREGISRVYNLLVKAVLGTHFSDAQCGFKAITKQAANELLPLVEDKGWFFDTELLVLAEKLGYRIFDLPVRWTENSDSTVKIWRTAIEDIKGIIRLRRNLARGKYRGLKRKSVFGPCSNAKIVSEELSMG